jgi:hypothetical protein
VIISRAEEASRTYALKNDLIDGQTDPYIVEAATTFGPNAATVFSATHQIWY